MKQFATTGKNALTNIEALNYVRAHAGLDYQARIPVVDQGNIAQTMKQIQSYEPSWNAFVNVLINGMLMQIIRVNEWNNPLAQFKQGRLVNYGTWIQEIGMGLLRAHHYDDSVTNVFDADLPEIYSNFHTQNRQDRYDLRVNEIELRQAMWSGDVGLAGFLNTLMQVPFQSDQQDEYVIMRELFALANQRDEWYNVHVDDITGLTDPTAIKDAAQDIVSKLREMVIRIGFRNRAYNAAHLPAVCTDPVLFVDASFAPKIDVYSLAQAFNMDKANFVGRVVTVDDLGLPGDEHCHAILADPDLFVCADTVIEARTMPNPKTLAINYFLHHWGVYSMSRFLPVIKFSSLPSTADVVQIGTVSSVSVTADPATTQPGLMVKCTATVTGTDDTPVNQGVRFELVKDDGAISSTNTFILGDGWLHIATDETSKEFTVRATSVQDPNVFGECLVTVEYPAADETEETGD